MTSALIATYVFVTLSQIAAAWLISMELWFLKARPWIAAGLQFLLGLVILAFAQAVAGMATTVVMVFGMLSEADVESSLPAWAAVSLVAGVIVLFVRLLRLAYARSRTLKWQGTHARQRTGIGG